MVRENNEHERNIELIFLGTFTIQECFRGTIFRLFEITSDWKNFDEDLGRAKKVFEANQYPPSAYNPLLRHSLNRTLVGSEGEQRKKESLGTTNTLYLQYRGWVSDWFKSKLQAVDNTGQLNAIFITRKFRTLSPSLKSTH